MVSTSTVHQPRHGQRRAHRAGHGLLRARGGMREQLAPPEPAVCLLPSRCRSDCPPRLAVLVFLKVKMGFEDYLATRRRFAADRRVDVSPAPWYRSSAQPGPAPAIAKTGLTRATHTFASSKKRGRRPKKSGSGSESYSSSSESDGGGGRKSKRSGRCWKGYGTRCLPLPSLATHSRPLLCAQSPPRARRPTATAPAARSELTRAARTGTRPCWCNVWLCGKW